MAFRLLCRLGLVTEMPKSREDHGHSVLIRSLYHFRIPERSSRLDDCGDPRLSRLVNAITEGKKGIGGE